MLHDLRFAFRTLRRYPGLAFTAIATLGLGIGLNTAVFGIVNLLLFKPPDVHEPSRLVWVASYPRGPEGPRGNLTLPDVEALRQQRVFSAVIGYADAQLSLGTGTEAERVSGQIVSGDLFGTLGVQPAAGRGFGATEAAPVVVISNALWARWFGGDPGAVGRRVTVNGQAFTIAGVAPPRFAGTDVFSPADVWVPMSAHALIAPRITTDRSNYWLRGIARLAPGVTIAQARAAVQVLATNTERGFPQSHRDFGLQLASMRGAGPQDRAELGILSALLLGVTVLVLLIACANVASLLLVRAAGRRREFGVRSALGGSRARIVRQLLVESSLLATGGGAAGLLLAMWGTDALVRFAQVPIDFDATPDARVLAFTLALAVATTLAFGLLPALRASGVSLFPALRDGVQAGIGRTNTRAQRMLVALQLVLALVLLTGAGLFIRSLAEARGMDVGFVTDHRFTVSYDLELLGYDDTRARLFNDRLLEAVRGVPGVTASALATAVPGGDRVHFTGLQLPGRVAAPSGRPEVVAYNEVSPGFFELMQLTVKRGRSFTPADTRGSRATAVVSEAFASTYWPREDPLGKRLRLSEPDAPLLEVIGVARDVLVDKYTEPPRPFVYVPHAGLPGETSLFVAASGDMAPVVQAVARVFARLDPNVATGRATTLEQHLAGRLDRERAMTKLLGVAAAMALLLSAMGLYGVMAHAVLSRVREIGVRVALGASRSDVLRLFLGEGARLIGIGLVCGLPLAFALSAALASSLVGVGAGDPLTLVCVSAGLASTMLLAAYVPARRALSVDPAIVLKVE